MSEVVAQLAARARELHASAGRRVLIGVAGEPGSGKSTLAEAVVAALGGDAVLVPMDGYHLAQRVLDALGRADRKGAPDTFDAFGYLDALERLRRADADIYLPAFERAIEEPIAAAIAVPASTGIVITEGNYLLLDTPPWSRVAGCLDEIWFLEVDQAVRRGRLIDRHIRFGKSQEAATAWVDGPDEANAALIRATGARADRRVAL